MCLVRSLLECAGAAGFVDWLALPQDAMNSQNTATKTRASALHCVIVLIKQLVNGRICPYLADYVRLLKYGDSLYRCKELKRAALVRLCDEQHPTSCSILTALW